MNKKCILIIGVRSKCYQAALALGYNVVLWSDGALPKKRRENLLGWIEEPYLESKDGLSDKFLKQLSEYKIDKVIANTEETVVLGSRVRAQLNLKTLAVDVTDRFHNKFIMKNLAKNLDVPITKYKIIDEDVSAESLIENLGLPLVVKPVDESGAQDIKVARDLAEVKLHMKVGLLAEAFVEGSELSVETFVKNGKPVFHNMTEYLHQWKKSVVPANFSKDLYDKIIEINNRVIEGFGVDRGMTHTEFYLTKSGPVFGEIAIRPPGGYYMDLIEKVYAFDPWKLYVSLCCGDEPASLPKKAEGCALVYLMHPGAGTIASISGVEDIKTNLKGIFDFSIRKNVGDVLAPHENTSNETGHILFWAPTRKELEKDLLTIENNLKFEMETKN